MKKALLLSLLAWLLSPAVAMANDGVYYTRGNHLVPLTETDISIRSEVLTISLLDNGYALVDVQYEFYNPSSQPKRLLMGFEADPPYNDDYRFHPSGGHPNIGSFTVEMNGHRLAYRSAPCLADTLPLQPIDTTKRYYVWDNNALYEEGHGPEQDEDDWENGIVFSYVYYFEATFQPGLNRVHHTYTYRLSMVAGLAFQLEYKLTPAARWAGGAIGDFTLIVRADSTAKQFALPSDIFPGTELRPTEGTACKQALGDDGSFRLYSMRNGALTLHLTHFTPQHELVLSGQGKNIIYSPDYRFGMCYDRGSEQELNYFDTYLEQHPGQEDFLRRVAHNLPYAHRGHVFRDAALRSYFESLWWYLPDPTYRDSTRDFTPIEHRFLAL